MAVFPPPWESGPGPADPALSAIKTGGNAGLPYTGNGYSPTRYTDKGTIGVGNPVVVAPQVSNPAQLRFYLGTDGNLYALDNKTGKAFIISPAATAPQPSVYSPTK
jgi:hypothetical protein